MAVAGLARASVGLLDTMMAAPYAWQGYEDEGLRFALLMAYHELRDLAFKIESSRPAPAQAERILGGFIEAHADLAGLLASASDAEVDQAPGPEEWPLREVVRHILGAETGFVRACRRALSAAAEGRPAVPYTQKDWVAWGATPAVAGGRDAVMAALLASRDAVTREFGGLSDQQLELPVYYWEDEALPLRFRLIRFELHLRQHTIQADKTMAGIGHRPSEAERLVRLVHAGLGDVERALLETAPGFASDLTSVVVAELDGFRGAIVSARA